MVEGGQDLDVLSRLSKKLEAGVAVSLCLPGVISPRRTSVRDFSSADSGTATP